MSFEKLVLRIMVEKDNKLNGNVDADASSLETSIKFIGEAITSKSKNNNQKLKHEGSKNFSKDGENHDLNKKNLQKLFAMFVEKLDTRPMISTTRRVKEEMVEETIEETMETQVEIMMEEVLVKPMQLNH